MCLLFIYFMDSKRKEMPPVTSEMPLVLSQWARVCVLGARWCQAHMWRNAFSLWPMWMKLSSPWWRWTWETPAKFQLFFFFFFSQLKRPFFTEFCSLLQEQEIGSFLWRRTAELWGWKRPVAPLKYHNVYSTDSLFKSDIHVPRRTNPDDLGQPIDPVDFTFMI